MRIIRLPNLSSGKWPSFINAGFTIDVWVKTYANRERKAWIAPCYLVNIKYVVASKHELSQALLCMPVTTDVLHESAKARIESGERNLKNKM
jgi:hypothetical protein